jgi:hypothetical protein
MNSEAAEAARLKAVATFVCAKSGVDFVNAAKLAFLFRRRLTLLVDVSPGLVDVRGEESFSALDNSEQQLPNYRAPVRCQPGWHFYGSVDSR